MRALTIIAISGALVTTIASPAMAMAEHRPRASLKVTITNGTAPPQVVRLTCNRDGGTHPTPRAACRVLRAVHGDPSELDGANAICTREFNPHTVKVKGTWRGHRVNFTTTYSNKCLMLAAGKALYTL